VFIKNYYFLSWKTFASITMFVEPINNLYQIELSSRVHEHIKYYFFNRHAVTLITIINKIYTSYNSHVIQWTSILIIELKLPTEIFFFTFAIIFDFSMFIPQNNHQVYCSSLVGWIWTLNNSIDNLFTVFIEQSVNIDYTLNNTRDS